jgi:hypothetical protein
MSIQVPFTNKAEDILKLLRHLPESGSPQSRIDAAWLKKQGISASSATYLLDILKKLRFLDEKQKPTSIWKAYVTSNERSKVLADAVSAAYAGLFKSMICPYLCDDEILLDYLRLNVDATPREIEYCLETFRALCEMADFQDVLTEYDSVEPAMPVQLPIASPMPQIKVDPNIQMNIQIHIDPSTSDEKIETIFKNLRKYLLDKD